MAASGKSEKRKHSRVEFATEIKVLPEAGGQGGVFNGSSSDLSLKGMFIRSQDVFPSGTQCLINVYLTGSIDKIELQMKGTIVRSSEEGMGIVFDSMDVDTYSHLKNIVNYNTREE